MSATTGRADGGEVGGTGTHRWLRYGDRGLLLELADTRTVLSAVAALGAPGGAADEHARLLLEDYVPGARTILLVARPGVDPERLRGLLDPDALADPDAETPAEAPGIEEVAVPVVYDGPDLDAVAEATGLSPAEVVAAHTGTPWRVGFGGFAPGFAYLVDGDPRLEVPRRARPRTRVPAGAVGLAGAFSGIYPRPSPGGWQLLGRTDATLWDLERDPPALLRPGMLVRFVAADAGADLTSGRTEDTDR